MKLEDSIPMPERAPRAKPAAPVAPEKPYRRFACQGGPWDGRGIVTQMTDHVGVDGGMYLLLQGNVALYHPLDTTYKQPYRPDVD